MCRWDTMSLQFCEERVDFCFPPPTPLSVPSAYSVPVALTPSISPIVVSGVKVSYGARGLHMRSVVLSDLSLPILSCFGGNTF